jgi:hypothetical protein
MGCAHGKDERIGVKSFYDDTSLFMLMNADNPRRCACQVTNRKIYVMKW